MLTNNTELDFDIFNLDPKLSQSSLFKNFLFNTEEISRIREYLLDFRTQYPFLKLVDELLLATYTAKIDFQINKFDRGIAEYIKARDRFIETQEKTRDDKAQTAFMRSAASYCEKSLKLSINSIQDKNIRQALVEKIQEH